MTLHPTSPFSEEQGETLTPIFHDGSFRMHCAWCEDPIRQGHDYAEFKGETICGTCADEYRRSRD